MEPTPFFFGLYKLVKYGVYPLTWIVGLSGLILLFAWLPFSPTRQRWLRLSTLALSTLLLILTSPLVAHVLVAALEGQHLPSGLPEPVANGTIVVLGAGLLDPGSLRPTVELTERSIRQTVCGADLYHRGSAPSLLITGGDARVVGSGPTEAAVMKEFAGRLGVPAASIITENRARTTYENAANTKALLGDRTSIILVASATHMPRAVALFRAQGFDVRPSPCGFHERNRGTEGWGAISIFDVLPATWAFRTISEAIEELACIAVYRLAGKL
ncbi:MAG: YdcF family protein [Nitrospira sp.]|nr:YdcF family protein [Nitrospira sp.]